MNLLACSACDRQLNVTGLDPGETVRCVCGQALNVAAPRKVTVRGLTCGHCGAPVGRQDDRCGHCDAGLSARDRVESMLCPSCAERLPEDSRHCKSCGTRLRAQAIVPVPPETRCPACEGPMQLRLLEEGQAIECTRCEGLWIGEETFRALREAAHRAGVQAPRSTDVPAATVTGEPPPARLRQYVPCVECGEQMLKRQFHHRGRSSRILVDVCKDHGIWFDHGELTAALRFVSEVEVDPGAVGRSTLGPPSTPPVRRRARRRAQSEGSSWWGHLLGDLLTDLLLWDFFDL